MDASRYATGAVLSQLCKDDKWHLVGFTSKSLSDMGRNYEMHDKELLSVIWGLEEWRHILEGTWHMIEILFLAQFNLSLIHRPGNIVGDICAAPFQGFHWHMYMVSERMALRYAPSMSVCSSSQLFCVAIVAMIWMVDNFAVSDKVSLYSIPSSCINPCKWALLSNLQCCHLICVCNGTQSGCQWWRHPLVVWHLQIMPNGE